MSFHTGDLAACAAVAAAVATAAAEGRLRWERRKFRLQLERDGD